MGMAGSLRTGIWRIGKIEAPLPEYMTSGAAGVDLCAAIAQPLEISPGERVLVSTGLGVAVPPGFEGQVRPRSGLAVRSGITVLNSPGTIDSDYRGELRVALINLGGESVMIEPLERIAQLAVTPVVQVVWDLLRTGADDLPIGETTERGAGGFGHTGRKTDRTPD
jgi:dUTP pyrophosphatase